MYIEYYIIENLLINYIIISCTIILTKRHSSNKKKWIGSILGTIYSVAYLYPSLDILFTLVFKIIIIIFITMCSFEYKGLKEYISTLLVFFLVNIFVSGTTLFIIYFTGIERLKISFIIICTYISGELLKYIYNDIKTIKQIKDSSKDIKIKFLGKDCLCKALLDTGNLLKDPTNNNSIVIVKPSMLKEILPKELLDIGFNEIDIMKVEEIINILDTEIASRIRIIPYSKISNSETNIIIGLKLDYLEVDENKIGNVTMGISNFEEGDFEAIINPNVLV